MNYELKLTLKYFRAKRKSLARFTSIVAIAGIAAGVSSLIVAQALANGFADEMRDKILANTAHIAVFMKDGSEISNWEEIKANNRRALELDPNLAEGYLNRSLYHRSEYNWVETMEDIKKAYSLDSKNSRSCAIMANILLLTAGLMKVLRCVIQP